MKPLLIVAVLAGSVLAHGGIFRGPPAPPVRDPTAPGGRLVTTPSSIRNDGDWARWWDLNRDRFLRLRRNVTDRVVTTGTDGPRTDPVDRAAIRERLLPVLVAALDDRATEVRAVAAVALGRLNAREHAAPLLERAAKDSSRSVREAAALGVALLGDPAHEAWMRGRFVRDKDEARVRGFMLIGLAKLGHRAYLERVMLGEEKLRGSNSDVEDLRACAAFALGHMKDVAAQPALARIATQKKEPRHLRGFAAAALGHLESPLSTPEVLRLLRDRDELHEARYGAAIAVGGVVGPGETGTLDLLGGVAQKDPNGGVRALLFMSLGRIGGALAAKEIAEEATTTREQTMRGFAYVALGMSRAPGAGKTLLEEYGRRGNVDDRAACALGMGLAGHTAGADTIRTELGRGNALFVPWGALALGMLGDKKSEERLQLLVERARAPRALREAATGLALLKGPAALPAIVERYRSTKSIASLGALAQVLGEGGNARTADMLFEAAAERKANGAQRAMALAALGRLAEPDPISPFSRYSIDVNAYVTCSTVEVLVSLF